MRKEITFTDSGDGLIPVAIYYDNDENEFDRVTLQLNDALSQITESELKSLILAQIERWRNALHMQVERHVS